MRPFMFITRRQRMGLFFLTGSIFLLVVLYFTMGLFFHPENLSDQNFENEIEAHTDAAEPQAIASHFNYFPFDPNIIGKTQMLELGLTNHQADMIIKYRDAGGWFYNAKDFGKIYAISDAEYELLKPYIIIGQQNQNVVKSPKAVQTALFGFDPNSADSTQLMALGLSTYQTANILKYRKAGGTFTSKKDFNKIYGIDADTYQNMEKYILLPSEINTPPATTEAAGHLELIEINTANTLELCKLKGIGEVYANRITAYRDKLGGFFDKSQLLEIYGIDTSRYAMFAPQVVIDKSVIRRININDATFDILLKHPYLEYYIVKEIFSYRETIGVFDSIAQLKNISLIYDQLYFKIAPYLTTVKRKDLP
ncbi:MAG TPA: helix-hairpin-helix domain-containing protein [Bacteroidales bacterium]|nr:helix-hairpin-helix domain-containing protein [Bacteroidales bacterium]